MNIIKIPLIKQTNGTKTPTKLSKISPLYIDTVTNTEIDTSVFYP